MMKFKYGYRLPNNSNILEVAHLNPAMYLKTSEGCEVFFDEKPSGLEDFRLFESPFVREFEGRGYYSLAISNSLGVRALIQKWGAQVEDFIFGRDCRGHLRVKLLLASPVENAYELLQEAGQ